MKLASLRDGGPDGALVAVSRDLTSAVSAKAIAATMQAALEDWDAVAPGLADLYEQLEAGAAAAFSLEGVTLESPLPRAYQFLDGSAYLHHAELVRKARGAELPPSFLEDPMMYQVFTLSDAHQ